MRKVKKVVLIVLIIIILIPLLIAYMPIKKADMNIELEKGSTQNLSSETKQIYIGGDGEITGWFFIGQDGVWFNSGKTEEIFICGNFPKELNLSLKDNIFVLNGEYIGRKKSTNSTVEADAFRVKSWGILGDIKRNYNEDNPNKSTKYLTLLDYGLGRSFPTGVRDESELEDVD